MAAHELRPSGVILAAGRSSRAGVFKPAFLHGGRPLVLHAVDGMRPWCGDLAVVAGHRHADLAPLVGDAAPLVVNPDPDRGMFSSIQAGLEAVGRGGRAAFILPVDCPFVDAAVYARLLDMFESHDGRRSIIPTHEGRGGHPVLLAADHVARVLAASSDTNLRAVLGGLDTVRLEVDHRSVLADLDTPADLSALARGDDA